MEFDAFRAQMETERAAQDQAWRGLRAELEQFDPRTRLCFVPTEDSFVPKNRSRSSIDLIGLRG